MNTFSEQIRIDASIEDVWKVLADIGSIHRWNPGVEDSYLTTTLDHGLGAGRRCRLDGKNYLDEEVVEWERLKILPMRIIATNLAFKTADIKFTLRLQADQTLVTVAPTYRLKYGLLGKCLNAVFVRSQYRKGMVNLLRGLKSYIERSPNREPAKPST